MPPFDVTKTRLNLMFVSLSENKCVLGCLAGAVSKRSGLLLTNIAAVHASSAVGAHQWNIISDKTVSTQLPPKSNILTPISRNPDRHRILSLLLLLPQSFTVGSRTNRSPSREGLAHAAAVVAVRASNGRKPSILWS